MFNEGQVQPHNWTATHDERYIFKERWDLADAAHEVAARIGRARQWALLADRRLYRLARGPP